MTQTESTFSATLTKDKTNDGGDGCNRGVDDLHDQAQSSVDDAFDCVPGMLKDGQDELDDARQGVFNTAKDRTAGRRERRHDGKVDKVGEEASCRN